jgi:hypothetical protein
MENSKKIEIAKEFVALHKNNNIDDWVLRCADKDQAHIIVYRRLVDGVYGEVRDNAEYDDDGEIEVEATEFEIEIGRFDSKSGNPVIFEWEV